MNLYLNSVATFGLALWLAGNVIALDQKEQLIDPDMGFSLASMDIKAGEIVVTDANVGEGKAAKCRIVSGSGFNRGNFVRIE